VQYIEKQYGGEAAIAKLLGAYHSTADTAAALKAAFGVSKEDFEVGYRKYLEKVAKASGGRKPEKAMTFTELESAHKKNPDDLDLAARYAGALVPRGETDEARKLAEAIRAKEKGHPFASIVLARLLKRAKDVAGAKKVLQEAAEANPTEGRVLLELGKLYFELKEYDKCAATFEKGRKAAPGDADWLDLLAKVYGIANNPTALTDVLAEQILAKPDDLALHIRLVKLLTNAGKHAEAERVARNALYIDLMNKEAKNLLIEALAAQKKNTEIETLRKRYE
jgi:predicted Zn-dependent protease